jgi:hypothetical protein
VASQEGQPEPAEQRFGADFDSRDGERAVPQGELDVAYPCEALASEIDDLRVENMALEQQLVLAESGGLRPRQPAKTDPCRIERSDVLPWNVNEPPSSQTNPQAHDTGLGLEPHNEVVEAADRGSLCVCDFLAETLGEPKHGLPGLRAAAQRRAEDSGPGVDRYAAGREGEDRVEVELGDNGQVFREA